MPNFPPGYARLKEFVIIDPARLDEEVIKHAPMFLEVCEAAADAAEARDIAANKLDYEKARLRRDLREESKESGKKLTNDDIDGLIVEDRIILDLMGLLERAKHDVLRWNGLLEAFRAKASALKRLGELMHAGYQASTSVLQTPRERIREASQEAPRRARREI